MTDFAPAGRFLRCREAVGIRRGANRGRGKSRLRQTRKAACSVSEGMAFIAANDTTNNTANAATSFPFRTSRTSSHIRLYPVPIAPASSPADSPRKLPSTHQAGTKQVPSRHQSSAEQVPSMYQAGTNQVPSRYQSPSVSDGKKAGAFRHRPETCSYSRAQPAAITAPGPSSARRRDDG